MRFNEPDLFRRVKFALLVTMCAVPVCGPLSASNVADLSATYRWNPVRLGAGGFVSGFISHPKDASVRYCRTDVGNAYRWDAPTAQWLPMVVRTKTGGLPAGVTAAPQQGGVISLGIDPNNPNVVFMTYAGGYSSDVSANYPAVPGSIYKSRDGGKTFTGSDLNVSMSPNSDDKFYGERISVDPNNSASVYYGSEKNGLWHSVNGGANWTQVSGNGSPSATSGVTRILFPGNAIIVVGQGGSVYKSLDGGSHWSNISAGTPLDGTAGNSEADGNGAVYVIQGGSRNIWKYLKNAWTTIQTDVTYEKNVDQFALDLSVPNGQRIYALGGGGCIARTDDGGRTWKQWGDRLEYAAPFSWLPQTPGYRNCGCIAVDRSGTVWVAQGNEGMLSYTPNGNETWNSAKFTIDSKGIEEFVSHDVILPPGGKAVVAVEDSTALYVNDPDQLSAKQATLQTQLISDGTGLAYCPNAPSYVVCTTADVNHTNSAANYAGYSTDGGQTWQRFAGDTASGNVDAAGSIAVSRRNGWGLGSDHLVWLPSNGDVPHYSTDGGATWSTGSGFPTGDGYWNFSLKQRQLAADPFVADKFYCEGTWKGGFYVSTDGGKTWAVQPNAGLPQDAHHGQLAVNRNVQNDLWFADGWEGAVQHGLWHSKDGGQTFSKIPGIEHAITLTLGAGRGNAGDAPSTAYFYGKMSVSPDWGVFRSTDSGATWDRISDFPTGLVDEPTCMAASWDSFSTVYIGFNGNSFIYGTTSHATKLPYRKRAQTTSNSVRARQRHAPKHT